MHDHESEVVGEGVGHEEPLARVVLKPHLGLGSSVSVEDSQSASLHFAVNVEGRNLFAVYIKEVIQMAVKFDLRFFKLSRMLSLFVSVVIRVGLTVAVFLPDGG